MQYLSHKKQSRTTIIATTKQTMSINIYPDLILEGDLSPDAAGSEIDDVCDVRKSFFVSNLSFSLGILRHSLFRIFPFLYA
jgi:hypothetical protein